MKERIKHITIITLKIVAAGGAMAYLCWSMIVANVAHDQTKCHGVNIRIDDPTRMHLLSERDVREVVEEQGESPVNKSFEKINLGRIEGRVAVNPLVREVNCYRLTSGELSVSVSLREPYLRVADPQGGFYLDKLLYRIPLMDNWTMPLPVLSGNVTTDNIHKITPLVEYISSNAFWLNTIEQIHIKENGDIELIPSEGDFSISLGKANNFDQKFHRIKVFYDKIVPLAGLGRYKRVDVRFNKQIVALKREIEVAEYIEPENDGNE